MFLYLHQLVKIVCFHKVKFGYGGVSVKASSFFIYIDMIAKKKKCSKCLEDKYIWKNVNGEKLCKECAYSTTYNGVKSTIKQKPYKKTGEKELMELHWILKNKTCEITGTPLPIFDVWNHLHLLGKGAYPSYRLNIDNLVLAIREIHTMFDCGSKEDLIAKYPKAIMLYEKRDKLRYEYYNGKGKG